MLYSKSGKVASSESLVQKRECRGYRESRVQRNRGGSWQGTSGDTTRNSIVHRMGSPAHS